MNNLRLLNKIFFHFFFLISIVLPSYSEETVDIWKNDTVSEITENETPLETEQKEESSLFETIKPLKNNIEEENNLEIQKNILAGLFDPQENNLDIDMWSNSDGQAVIRQLKKIDKIKLSEDAEDILFKTLFTNSYPPTKNIDPSIFINYKSEWLINKKKTNLIKLFLEKNSNLIDKSELIKFLVDESLTNAAIDSACENVKFLDKNNESIYLEKFKIYCLIYNDRKEEAQLVFDLLKERGFKDKFFEDKINFLLGITNKTSQKISDDNLLNFFLSHITSENFEYEPTEKTDKYIWRYLSSANLIKVEAFENENVILTYEQAAEENSFESEEIFNIYKQVLFSVNQLINATEVYKNLPGYKARALIYQAVLLSDDIERKLYLAFLLQDLFIKDKLFSVYSEELSNILKDLDPDQIPESYNELVKQNLSKNLNATKIEFDNDVLHRSKVLKHFIDNNEKINRTEKDFKSVYKKIKKNKKYFISIMDIIVLESLVVDGMSLPKELNFNELSSQLTVPKNLQDLVNQNQLGLVMLKIIEIIGEDSIPNLDPETMRALVAEIADVSKQGAQVILVTSGAIAAGREAAPSVADGKGVAVSQMLAAIGQGRLMHAYQELFSNHRITVAQALITRKDVEDRIGYLNVRNTLEGLISKDIVPIVNENDVVDTAEINELRFGDNDTLSALVANIVDADLLLMLTDTGGLFTADPNRDPSSHLIPRVDVIDASVMALAKEHRDRATRGGMSSKLVAAKRATDAGVTVVFSPGVEAGVVMRAVHGDPVGTLFPTARNIHSWQFRERACTS